MATENRGHFRFPPGLMDAAKKKAALERTTVTAVVVAGLTQWVGQDGDLAEPEGTAECLARLERAVARLEDLITA